MTDFKQAFCNLMVTTFLNPDTGKWNMRFVNSRILYGPSESMAACKVLMDKHMKDGTFEVVGKYMPWNKTKIRHIFDMVMDVLKIYSCVT